LTDPPVIRAPNITGIFFYQVVM